MGRSYQGRLVVKLGSLLFLSLSALDSCSCEQIRRGLLRCDFFELLILRDNLRREHRFVDVSQECLALAHTLAELEV